MLLRHICRLQILVVRFYSFYDVIFISIGEYGVTRLPDDYYFLPISSPIQRSQCVFPCTLRTQPGQTSFYGSSATGGEVSGSASEQEDKVIVIHEHHHHHHHRNITDEDPVDVLETAYTEEVPFTQKHQVMILWTLQASTQAKSQEMKRQSPNSTFPKRAWTRI